MATLRTGNPAHVWAGGERSGYVSGIMCEEGWQRSILLFFVRMISEVYTRMISTHRLLNDWETVLLAL